jgi:hypothetical protein
MEDKFRTASYPVQNRTGSEPKSGGGDVWFSPRALETFVDLGLSDGQIARYFRISETKVIALRRDYGLAP